jgi:hypothetical protein
MRAHSRAPLSQWISLLALATVALMCGCSSVKATGTSRSGTEQLLLTGAWDSALCTVDFRPLAGQKVYLDPQRVNVVDKDWVLSSTRRAMAEQGVLLENNKDHAQVIVEAALGAYGTDERNCWFGLPQIGVVPTVFGASLATPSGSSSSTSATALALSQTNRQDAVVKAALFAYDAKSGRLVWESGPILNAQGVRDHFAVGTGPYRISSLQEVEQFPQEAQDRTRRRFWQRFSLP